MTETRSRIDTLPERRADPGLQARYDELLARKDELYWLERAAKAALQADDEFLAGCRRAALDHGCSEAEVDYYTGDWAPSA